MSLCYDKSLPKRPMLKADVQVHVRKIGVDICSYMSAVSYWVAITTSRLAIIYVLKYHENVLSRRPVTAKRKGSNKKKKKKKKEQEVEAGYKTYCHPVAASTTAKECLSYPFESAELSMDWEAFCVAMGFGCLVLFP